jgi:mannose-6-phosphate isomerase
MEVYPLKFHPIYKERIWGGEKLKRFFNRRIPESCSIGESWEVCAHQEGSSIIASGTLKGESILSLWENHREEFFGQSIGDGNDVFPFLIKWIDARERLSVQVHPDDRYAWKQAHQHGKTEIWYVIDAKHDARLIYGLKKGVTKEVYKQAIKKGKIEHILHQVAVKKGDVLLIPAGTIHAIGEGILIGEIQQNSDITYRVYDWNRLGLDGKPRLLHVEKAMQVVDFEQQIENPIIRGITIKEEGYLRRIYICCPYFTMEVLEIKEEYQGNLNGERFEIFMNIEGDFDIIYGLDQREGLVKGETVLIPASIGGFILKGKGKMIRTYRINPSDFMKELIYKGIREKEMDQIVGWTVH